MRACQIGPLKFLNPKYDVLQLDILNFESTSTGKLILEKDKTCQTW